ncbi:hypothetical protein E2C01_094176 [Portunus trituberculatus]|uniref:Uncharacterized protein n=1 Tax=Portunus trituberculatus TaxID=210409 RepID=A0A5B7K2E3_PORTR|nr:hypothetical protein [Portunus trituberculatus]
MYLDTWVVAVPSPKEKTLRLMPSREKGMGAATEATERQCHPSATAIGAEESEKELIIGEHHGTLPGQQCSPPLEKQYRGSSQFDRVREVFHQLNQR